MTESPASKSSTQAIIFAAFVVASGITADVERGIIDRFRSLLISRMSVLTAVFAPFALRAYARRTQG